MDQNYFLMDTMDSSYEYQTIDRDKFKKLDKLFEEFDRRKKQETEFEVSKEYKRTISYILKSPHWSKLFGSDFINESMYSIEKRFFTHVSDTLPYFTIESLSNEPQSFDSFKNQIHEIIETCTIQPFIKEHTISKAYTVIKNIYKAFQNISQKQTHIMFSDFDQRLEKFNDHLELNPMDTLLILEINTLNQISTENNFNFISHAINHASLFKHYISDNEPFDSNFHHHTHLIQIAYYLNYRKCAFLDQIKKGKNEFIPLFNIFSQYHYLYVKIMIQNIIFILKHNIIKLQKQTEPKSSSYLNPIILFAQSILEHLYTTHNHHLSRYSSYESPITFDFLIETFRYFSEIILVLPSYHTETHFVPLFESFNFLVKIAVAVGKYPIMKVCFFFLILFDV